jgi:dipeptidyl aminopeptidase/acylaminoacyl peptidase
LVTLGLAEFYARAHTQAPCPGLLFDSPADLGLPYEEITLTARDGVQVPGWYVPSQNGAIIIAAPGFNGNRTHALFDFGFLASEGYGLLVFDQRHCTDSSIPQTLGYNEAQDMLGAVDYLRARADVERIGAIGFSAGGVTTILAAAQEPAIEATVEVGGYYNLEADILDPQYEHGLYDRFLRRLIVGAFKRQTGIHPRQFSPVDVVDEISPRPLLLIYGEYEALSGQLLYEAAGEPKELWIVEGAGHGGYEAAAPGEYQQRVSAFFDAHLLSDIKGTP